MRQILMLAVFCCLTAHAFSQDEADYTKKTNIIPPSPIAASLGTFGGSSPNLITGAASVSVPIYNFSVGNSAIPISVSYNSTGLKVDDNPSYVGTGWALNAGGVISRIIYDAPDEEATRVYMPNNPLNNKREFNWFLQQANSGDDNQGTDAQPDQFSFNFPGGSGSFILDEALKPVQMKHSGLRIETDFSPSALWNFKITTTDGTQYFFGGVDATEYTKSGVMSCGLNHPAYKNTGWFLYKVVYPNSEIVNFSYTRVVLMNNSAISETLYKDDLLNGGCPGGCPAHDNVKCISYFTNSTLLLNQISATGRGSVTFTYVGRVDQSNSASLGDYLLSTITVNNPAAVAIKSYGFAYTHVYSTSFSNQWVTSKDKNRSFLTAINDKDNTNNTFRTTQFEYNNMTELPPRLSFAQDHWGYFNGANNTGSMIPKPYTFDVQQRFPTALANREPNETYAVKGMLKKVIYPTGGSDQFDYESNTVYRNKEIFPTSTDAYTTSQGTGTQTCVTNSVNITAPSNQSALLTMSTDDLGTYDPIHNKAFFNVYDVTTSSYVYQNYLVPAQFNTAIVGLANGHTYTISVQSCGSVVRGFVSLSYYASTSYFQYVNDKTGGIRVKRITSNPGTGASVIKAFKYAALSDLTKSSGVSTLNTQLNSNYYKTMQTRINCNYPAGTTAFCSSEAMFSNSLYNQFIYPGSNIQYQYVTESLGGDNFENGGIQHKYTVDDNIPANIMQGDVITGAPFTNASISGGNELEQIVFDKDLKYVKKTVSEYTDDPARQLTYNGYVVNMRVSLPLVTDDLTPGTDQLDSYNLSTYQILSRWIYKNKDITYTYDQNGTATLAEQKDYEYGNPEHALPTKVTVYTSTGDKKATEFKYAADYKIINDKTPFEAKNDFNSAFATAKSTFNSCIASFNAQLVPITGQMSTIAGNCFSLIWANCSYCNINCQNVQCQEQWMTSIETCKTLGGYYTLQTQRDNLLATYTCTGDFTTSSNTAVTNYNQAVTNYYAALNTAIAGTADEHNKAVLTMQSKDMKDAAGEKTESKVVGVTSTQLTHTTNRFKVWPGGFVEPASIKQSIKQSPDVTTLTFTGYDSKSNLSEFITKDGLTTSVIWDYNQTQPIAKVVNATSDNIAYSSFESDGSGNWSIASAIRATGGVTGKSSYLLTNGSISRSGLTAATTYIVSYWSVSGATATVTGTIGSAVQGKTININGTNWTNYQHRTTGSTTITVSGSATIDELRLYPESAQMTTLTYEPLVGMTTQCDLNNHISYYEYDAAGRLIVIRDEDRNVIKQFCYNYYGQTDNCSVYYSAAVSGNYTRNNCSAGAIPSTVTYTVPAGKYAASTQSAADALAQNDLTTNGQAYANVNGTCTQIFYNTVQSGNFTRNNCTPANQGTTVTYTVPANTYSSTVDQATANQLAINDVQANGQAYANANGTCCANCPAPTKRCINGLCVRGLKVYTSSTYNSSSGTYLCIFHYEFPDGAWTPDFSEDSPTPCL